MQGERSLRGMGMRACKRQKILLASPALGLRAVKPIPGPTTFWQALSTLPEGALERALRNPPGAESEAA
jgi:hypothetical protein